jgi:diguanylate cyclase (GGDEF)-like protein/PAS domain S-box-containing protein
MFAYLKNCSLFQQLIIPMFAVGIIGVGAIVVSAIVLQDSVNALGDLSAAGNERLKALQEVDKDIANFRALSLKHLASESARAMADLDTELKAIESENRVKLPALCRDTQARVPEETEALRDAITRYFSGIDEAIQLSSDFEKEFAFEKLTEVEGRYLTAIQDAMQSLARHAFEDISASREDLTAAVQRNLQITIGIGILGGGMLLGMAFFVTRRASRRISGLLAWSRRIADGDLSNTLTSDAGDEVGQLTNAMRSMVGNIARGRDELEGARKDAEAVAEELRLYANAFESSGEPMLITDRANRIIDVNAAFTAQTGYSLDEVLGRDPKILTSGDTPKSVYQEMWDCLRTGGYWRGELWDRKKTGEVFPKWASISAIRDDNQDTLFYIASFSDISERKVNEARIDYLAHHDPLTGLINRYNLDNRLSQALLSAQRDDQRVAVMFIDMDRFKTINDTLGHHVGDQLLIEVARRLKASVRESDIVARLGGDEFVVVLTAMAGNMDAAPVAEKILRALGHPYTIDGNELHSSPSIGIAVCPGDGEDGETLMKNADAAMYHAKEFGRNNIKFFTAELNSAASERMTLEYDLRQALRDSNLYLHYQPQVRARDYAVFGVEALARWRHPVLGDIPPLKFIPIAEESGLVEALGGWVLDEACRQLAAWRGEGIDGIRVAVNLSAQQLRSPDLAQSVSALLRRHGLKGRDLELEITESVAMENPERAISQLRGLRDLGIQLAIDDFGTGYSSLAYLKRLPIHVLKLDRTFVRDIETDESDAEISAATLALAHNLGLRVIAEGVETEAQRDFLIQHQCDYLQGFLFSKPLPADAVPEYCRTAAASPLKALA